MKSLPCGCVRKMPRAGNIGKEEEQEIEFIPERELEPRKAPVTEPSPAPAPAPAREPVKVPG